MNYADSAQTSVDCSGGNQSERAFSDTQSRLLSGRSRSSNNQSGRGYPRTQSQPLSAESRGSNDGAERVRVMLYIALSLLAKHFKRVSMLRAYVTACYALYRLISVR